MLAVQQVDANLADKDGLYGNALLLLVSNALFV